MACCWSGLLLQKVLNLQSMLHIYIYTHNIRLFIDICVHIYIHMYTYAYVHNAFRDYTARDHKDITAIMNDSILILHPSAANQPFHTVERALLLKLLDARITRALFILQAW